MSEKTRRTVGFVGIGNIGGPMARCLKRNGYDLTVCDQNEAALKSFRDLGARTATEPRELGRENVVVFMVSNDQQLKEAVMGPKGLFVGICERGPSLVIVMSTVLPATIQEVATALRTKGVRVIDAPVSGGPIPAEKGELTIMTGGELADLESAKPILETMGQRIIHCGSLGNGEMIKIVNNLVGVSVQFLVAEAFQLAHRSGVDLARLVSVMDTSSGRNFWSRDWEQTQQQYNEYASDLPKLDVFLQRSVKDFKLALQLAGEEGVSMPILETVTDTVSRMQRQDVYDRFHSFT
jgi:3-hydroxyisobutyrate dehydrogenase